MKRFVFIITYPLLWFISKLPFFVLHLFSDFIFVILFYLVGYRKEVVLQNLKYAFPEKSKDELKVIRRKFFRHFVDIFIEMIKSFTISEKEINKRYKYINKEIFKDIEAMNKSVILMGSHYANWEWIINICSYTKLHCVGAFTRLTNPHYNQLIKTNRSRFGSEFVQTSKTIKKLIKYKLDNKLAIYGLLSDQSPSLEKTHYWAEFLNVKVPIHTGAEMLAKKHNFALVHMKVNKVKRSHYEIEFEILSENPQEIPDYQITDDFLRRTEAQIHEKPEFYFWTHKRFKYKDHAPNTSRQKRKKPNK